MRIKNLIILLMGIYFTSGIIFAADEGITLDKIVLDSKWRQTDGFISSLGLKAGGDWPWLESGFDLKLCLPNTDSYYSSCDLGLVFPYISDNLAFNLNYQWNTKYQSHVTGFDYKLKPYKCWAVDLGYSSGRRGPLPGYNSRYYYIQSRKQAGFEYQRDHFQYNLEYTYADKNYPEAEWYTSKRQTLKQGVTWKPDRRFIYNLGYREATGNYPCDNSFTRGFWKAAWTLAGDQKFNDQFRWKWDCGQLEWDQGYKSKRRAQNFHLLFEWEFNPLSNWQTDLALTEKIYSNEVEYDPDETEDPEEELASRCERKLIVKYNHNFGRTAISLGMYAASLDYYFQDGKDGLIIGVSGSWSYKSDHWKTVLKAAPFGSLSRNTGFYQLKLEYDLDETRVETPYI